MDNKIQFTVIEEGSERIIETNIGEYRSLMVLLKDELYLDCFGECGGVGRCATCIVKTSGVTGGFSNQRQKRAHDALQNGL